MWTNEFVFLYKPYLERYSIKKNGLVSTHIAYVPDLMTWSLTPSVIFTFMIFYFMGNFVCGFLEGNPFLRYTFKIKSSSPWCSP